MCPRPHSHCRTERNYRKVEVLVFLHNNIILFGTTFLPVETLFNITLWVTIKWTELRPLGSVTICRTVGLAFFLYPYKLNSPWGKGLIFTRNFTILRFKIFQCERIVLNCGTALQNFKRQRSVALNLLAQWKHVVVKIFTTSFLNLLIFNHLCLLETTDTSRWGGMKSSRKSQLPSSRPCSPLFLSGFPLPFDGNCFHLTNRHNKLHASLSVCPATYYYIFME